MLARGRSLLILSFGTPAAAELASGDLSARFGLRVSLEEADMPEMPRKGGQVNAESLLREVGTRLESTGCGLALGITSQDLYIPGTNFVFGLASGTRAVISVFRLQGQDPLAHRARVLKEAIHEIGHVIGLAHCPNKLCVMDSSNSLADTDRKGTEFCRECASRLEGLAGMKNVPSQS